MIGALKRLADSGAGCLANPRAPVPADVEKATHNISPVADDDDTLAGDIGDEKRARLPDFALMPCTEPSAGKKPVLLLCVNLPTDKVFPGQCARLLSERAGTLRRTSLEVAGFHRIEKYAGRTATARLF